MTRPSNAVEAAFEVPFDFGAIAEVRRRTRELLLRWDLPALDDDAALVVTELVANALVHARSPAAVRMVRSLRGVRIEVRDAGPGTPDPQDRDDAGERGRGLRVVAALSTAWGIRDEDGAKTVWAELSV